MNSLGLYDGYDSYNDSGGTTDDEENFDSNLLPPRYSQTKAAAVQKKNFLNGKDGMGMLCSISQTYGKLTYLHQVGVCG